MKLRIILTAMIMAAVLPLFAITAQEIIDKRDRNEYVKTAVMKSQMIIVNGSREITKTMKSYVDTDNVLVEFDNPKDRGTKFLKRGDDLWMFFPDAEELVKISGHMLKQGMMGSDFSYQDMMESEKLIDLYTFEYIGEDSINGRNCYIVEGTAVEGKEVSYYKRKSWIDSERFIGLKEELYAKSGKLLKEMSVSDVKKIEGRWFPMKSIMVDKLKKDTRTEFVVDSIEFNTSLPEGIFKIENLR